jgi:RecB family exonuclease
VGLAAVTFVTPYRLAELLGAAPLASTGRRPVSTPVLAAAMRDVLLTDPGVFGPVAHHPATEAALVAAYRELRDVTPKALRALGTRSPRARDVVRLHLAARDRLEPEWYDEEDLMSAAAASLDAGMHEGALGAVVVYLLQRISRHAALLLDAASRAADLHVVAGFTGNVPADAEVATSLGRLDGTLPDPPVVDPLDVADSHTTRLVTTSDADDEVRAAVRAVVDATRAGTPLDRIAVLYASAQPYARLAHEQLAAAGIQANGAAVVPVAARMAGRALLQLLALPEGGFRRQDVFAWLSAAPAQHEGRLAPVSAWERLSRDAAVVGGTDWDVRLASFAADLDAQAKASGDDPDEPGWRAERLARRATRARELRRFVQTLMHDLGEASARPRRWSEHAHWAGETLNRVLGGPARRERWPAVERKSAERVERALLRLGTLDAVEEPVGLDVFTRTLQLELEADLGRVGRFGTGVLVGSVGMGVGLDLDLVVVLGLAEGFFPGPVRDDSLLPDHERAAAAGQLPLAGERVERQHRELLATLAASTRHVLAMPRGDLRRSRDLMPSRWALAIASRLTGERVGSKQLLTAGNSWAVHVASFDGGLRTLHSPATEQEFRLRALLAQPGRDLVDPVLTQGVCVMEARRSDRFTRFDGNLGGLAVPSPVDRVMSATRLQRWATCPFDYFMQDVLRVEQVENPEEQLQITPLVRGDLVHRVLERFILVVLARPAGEQPRPDDPWSHSDRALMTRITDELCDEYQAAGLTGRPIFWGRDRAAIHADVQEFLTVDDQRRREERTRPIAAELAFGFDGSEVTTVPVTLPDGRVLRFRGKADRVDRGDDGTIRIVDYKTGKPDGYRGLSESDPDQHGTKLQLVIYGVAARLHSGDPAAPVHAEYWFVSRRGEFKCIGYPITPDVLERVGVTLGKMVAGIETGVFPNHPDPTVVSSSPWIDCHSCDPDALGITELRGRWERKRADPALADYADLAEPVDDVRTEDTHE